MRETSDYAMLAFVAKSAQFYTHNLFIPKQFNFLF